MLCGSLPRLEKKMEGVALGESAYGRWERCLDELASLKMTKHEV